MLRTFFRVSIAVVVALGGAEAITRALIEEPPHVRGRRGFVADSLARLAPCARRESRDGVELLVPLHPLTFGSDSVSADPRPGRKRFAIVGESTGTMLAMSFENDDRLAAALADRELLACAWGGASLEHVALRAEEVLDYSLDALVVVFGHNLRMVYPTDAAALRVQSWLLRSRILTSLSASIERRLFTGQSQLEGGSLRARLAELERVLDRIAISAERRGVRLVLATVAGNEEYPPGYAADAFTDRRFARIRLDHVAGRSTAAIAGLEELVRERPEPYWLFMLARWKADRGDLEAARKLYREAIDRSEIEPDRATTEAMRTIREVALRHGADLLDMAGVLEGGGGSSAFGWRSFSDNCHHGEGALAHHAERMLALLDSDELPPVDESALLISERTVAGMLKNLLLGVVATWPRSGRRHLDAVAVLVEHWLGESPGVADEAVQNELFVGTRPDYGSEPAPTYVVPVMENSAVPAATRAAVVAALARAYRWSGRLDDALGLLDHPWADGTADAAIERGLIAIAAGDESAASTAFETALRLRAADLEATALREALGRGPASRPSVDESEF